MLPEYVNISLSVLGGVIMGSEEAKTESFRSGVGVMREREVVGMLRGTVLEKRLASAVWGRQNSKA